MLLIDASKISVGGGLVLLRYLLVELAKKNISFFLIKDDRYKDDDLDVYPNKAFKNIFVRRTKIYSALVNKYGITQILCFGSVPPPTKFKNIVTYTYMHDPNIFEDSILLGYGLKSKLSRWFKKKYIKKNLENSNYYIFQTPYMKERFIETYKPNDSINLELYPFFDSKKMEKQSSKIDVNEKKYDFCYISVPNPHKNHLNLIKAWKLLNDRGFNPSLVLTIPENDKKGIYDKILLEIKGLPNIINIGYVTFEVALEYTGKSKMYIYPSYSETLGLGYIEAYFLRLPIITSDLKIAHNVIKPSLTFDPFSAVDIADKVQFSLENSLRLTELKLENKIDKIIKLLSNVSKSK